MPIAEQLVVAVAVLRHGEVLAARRAYPPEVAGLWELPGGKVETGETLADAATREIGEELGISVRVHGTLDASAPVAPGLRLVAVYAEGFDEDAAASGEGRPPATALRPEAREHSELRWLGPEELDSVQWIPADRVFLPELRERLLDGTPLPGGATGGAVRIGDTVRRPTGPWTPAVHAVLTHLRRVAQTPDVLGDDARGREVLSYIPGATIRPDTDDLTDAQIASCGRVLREIHDALATFRPEGELTWRYGTRRLDDGEVVCHNDPGAYNWAFRGDEAVGLFDWDMAGPGDPLDDLAFLAWTSVPLYRDIQPARIAHRLAVLAAAYGTYSPVVLLDAARRRMRVACERIAAGIDRGDPGMANLAKVGEPARTRDRLERLDRHVTEIEGALDAAAPGGRRP
ncbi:NUDIX domain-containing protein [Cumulibacter manganitolerans]|uniref:NUDIX domain-containing protein n=1 Tax=Cumulibacter manganitolerans TaxID=1884992 RepID=UPI001295FB52|nr:NUDIX domain-containing protein [Cumulibacter manganitolerans]